ncbi:HCL211Wp [Eremothecium sinecaudum]|uniref:E3 ubiquitin protein ligase n=1 Tax=Eremothecium sinecaudum TaxID=45286 RepID=A0A0X8HR77_9SACH|nr:HCL211Wp [Eremothecium sinecaudum]AMD19940.1 HCL211Wp [Eremothecium sinecaudum]
MTEPPTKKAKLELSDVSEPLTQRDVILFQKEALFRCMNRYRSEANISQKQVKELKESQNRFLDDLAAVCGVIRSIARVLVEGGDEETQKVCKRLENCGTEEVVQEASEFAKYVVNSLTKEDKLCSVDWDRWQSLEVVNGKLDSENKQLREELESMKTFYKQQLHRYDREESVSLKRVLKIAEGPEGEKGPTAKSPDAAAGSPSGRQGTAENGGASKGSDDLAVQVEQEMHIADLKTNIGVLENTVKQLTDWKTAKEEEIVKLRQAVTTGSSQLPDGQNAHSSSNSTLASATDVSTLATKVDELNEEKRELMQINDAYMKKFQQLSAEQEVFTNRLSSEFQTAQETLKKHNSNLEKDLVRIRTARDELLSKIALLEAKKAKSEMLSDLEKALEIQQEQLRALGNREPEPSQDALMKELQDLEKAFKELSNFSNKKYSEYINQESIISKLTVEKTKADQKYFAAMRSKDSILIENKNLTKNLTKSNELIQQLKDIEKTLQSKIENLHKQLQLSQTNEKRLIDSNKVTSLKIMDLTSQLTKSKKSSNSLQQELNKLVEEKSKIELKAQDLEMKISNLQIKLTSQENKLKKLHKILVSNGGDYGALADELENFRTVVYCSLCSKNWKDTAIKTCGHVFCASCCKERLAARMRKCPTCNKAFSSNDLLVVHL